MDKQVRVHGFTIFSLVCAFLILAALSAGCTTTAPQDSATPVITQDSVQPEQVIPETTATPVATPEVPVKTTESITTPAPSYTPSDTTLIVYAAASLKGVSKELASEFAAMYPGHTVTFNLDGTQALKTQVENGAYADVFISASNSYTKTLQGEGYFINSSVKPLTTNYVTVIIPASNPGNIKSLSDLATPGKKIALAAYSVPVGTASYTALANLGKSTYGAEWNASVFSNVITYETSEPAVATKVSLGEVDAGIVYESTYAAAPAGTLSSVSIPKTDNYLQTYSIAIMKETTNSGVAYEFENFMLAPTLGQQILRDYGFRPVS